MVQVILSFANPKVGPTIYMVNIKQAVRRTSENEAPPCRNVLDETKTG
jgi:hypothetical protein